MKIPPTLALLLPLALLGFTACEDEPEVAYPGGNNFGYQGGPGANTPPQYGAPYGQGTPPGAPGYGPGPATNPGANTRTTPAQSSNPPRSSNTTTSTAPSNPTTPPSGPGGSPAYPKGIPVPGKPGYVTSPYGKPDQYVDVRGYPPGMEVRDPYNGGIFLVP